jgi:hypothetical protein
MTPCATSSTPATGTALISVVSVEKLKELKRIKMSGVPRGMAFSNDGSTMVAAIFGGKSDSDRAGRTVTIDLETQKVTSTITSGGASRHAIRLSKVRTSSRSLIWRGRWSTLSRLQKDR